jgi:hypothetical protein
MLKIDEFKKILNESKIEIGENTDVPFLYEFSDIISDKIFDDFLINRSNHKNKHGKQTKKSTNVPSKCKN